MNRSADLNVLQTTARLSRARESFGTLFSCPCDFVLFCHQLWLSNRRTWRADRENERIQIEVVERGAAIGIPVAAVGAIGYIVSGWRVTDLPPWSLGFVLLPALAALVVGSVLTAPIGARAAHKLPVPILRRVFACLLYVLATKMVVTYW